jgi:hypothetical protein
MAGEIGAELQNMSRRAQPALEAVRAGLEEDESHSVNAGSAIPSPSASPVRRPMGPLARIACHWLSALKSRIAKRRAARLRRLRSRR